MGLDSIINHPTLHVSFNLIFLNLPYSFLMCAYLKTLAFICFFCSSLGGLELSYRIQAYPSHWFAVIRDCRNYKTLRDILSRFERSRWTRDFLSHLLVKIDMIGLFFFKMNIHRNFLFSTKTSLFLAFQLIF